MHGAPLFQPHPLVVDENNVVDVADRENGRIEESDLDGKFLREILRIAPAD